MADTLTSAQGDSLDDLLWRERGLGPDVLGKVLEANPGLADLGEILPLGTKVIVPVIAKQAVATREIIQLWS